MLHQFHTNRDLGALAPDRPSLLWCFTARYADTDTLLALAAKYAGRVRFLLIDRCVTLPVCVCV